MIKKLLYLICGLLLLTVLGNSQDPPPNIILIITDQHSGTIMTQRGYPYLQTPGIDKLADQGVTFTRGYCAYPVCTSSRRSIMTGMMASQCETVTDYPSIANTLQTSGYETGYFGKWHVGSTDIADVKDWHGFETYEDGHVDTRIRENSVDFIKKDRSKPFFMMTSFQNPHDCCELARIIAGMDDSYHDGPVEENMDTAFCPPLPSNFAIPENEAEGFYGRRNQEPGDEYWSAHPNTYWTTTEWRQYMYGYDRLVEKVDAHINLLVDELDSADLLDNTVIIYTADHGDGHGSHRWNQKKTFYEEVINIPVVISWKGKTKAGVIDEDLLINNGLDLYPTILKLAGLTIPETLHGMDLSPGFLQDPGGESLEKREYVISEISQKVYTGNTPGTFLGRMLVASDLKYVLFEKGVNREQLFDTKNDPGELSPVTDNPDYKDQLDSCRQMLKDWVAKIGDDFQVDNILSEYESDASLDGLKINDVPFTGFDPSIFSYTVKLKYSDSVIISAVPVNSGSLLTLNQASDPWGDEAARTATVHVVSEDGKSDRSYSITLDVAEYVAPESDARLSEIRINDIPIENFDEEDLNYTVTIQASDDLVISAIPNSADAAITITDPMDMQGDSAARTAHIQVVSKDGTDSKTYHITVESSGILFTTGFIDTGSEIPETGWTINYGLISEKIEGPGNHGEYEGAAAFKFVRGQADKQGYLRTSYYTDVKSISFWMYIMNPDNSAKLLIETQTGSENEKFLAEVKAADLSATKWTYFAYNIDRKGETRIIFTPTLPYDGDTRLWMDDLAIKSTLSDQATEVESNQTSGIRIFPNPARDYIQVNSTDNSLKNLTIYNLAGQAVLNLSGLTEFQIVPVSNLPNGLYLLKLESSSGVSTIKLIKQ